MNPKRLLFFCSILFTSCNVSYFDNEIEMKWSGDLNMPIGQINYTLSDVFQELDINDFSEDAEGNMSFNYIESISGGKNTSYDVAIEDLSFFIEILLIFDSEIKFNFTFAKKRVLSSDWVSKIY